MTIGQQMYSDLEAEVEARRKQLEALTAYIMDDLTVATSATIHDYRRGLLRLLMTNPYNGPWRGTL